ncbi:predicted protein [Thalassiosira pseudonana CCMP1335]|uniref:Uncharacterized protein n=1 Tax=Thalassiosira pseudonana TaxID=35128 RepID=B8CF67_THAPS|nr:predicted protein [Thalassiosira pseudonana CCMP1335]EED87575.1 predicted protein [Thalassiosira pseudonana CCMP1335]|eukprot:scaffold2273_cov209-Alexandrium_tamarense.AAC.8
MKLDIALFALCMHPPTSITAFSPSHHMPTSRKSTHLDTSALESLADLTTLSIDSGDIDTVARYAKTGLITDATTNPLFVSQAGANGDARYEAMVLEAVAYAKAKTCVSDGCAVPEESLNVAIDRLSVNLGKELVNLVPGRVSTEVDIRLSYDKEESAKRGTWEGIKAAEELEKEDIQCNITLVFSFLQAAAAAQAGAYLISPFPGRILDWHKKQSGKESYTPEADPGVLAVKRMYAYFRKYGYDTICMPASWRPSRGAGIDGSDVDEILALAGVDEMTIPQPLLDSLSAMESTVVSRNCQAESDGAACTDPNFRLTEESFASYWETDECGKEKLKEGMDAFVAETEKLIKILIDKF